MEDKFTDNFSLGKKKIADYTITQDKRIKIYKSKTAKISSLADWKSWLEVLHIEIEQYGQVIDQSYYMTKEGYINLIYPIFDEHENPHPSSE